jgi:5-methylcytosine-specific restriction endonuclease McrA
MVFVTSESHSRAEKEHARALRASRWWQNLIANAACYYCGTPLTQQAATMDHVVPVAQGGRSVRGNVVPACKACNTAKGGLSAAEWLLLRERATVAARANEDASAMRAEPHQVRDQEEEKE